MALRHGKLRLLLGLILYVLVVQWVLVTPVVLVLLVLGLVHHLMKFLYHLVKSFFHEKPAPQPSKTVLINGCSQAAALHMARMLSAAGHRVVACDYSTNFLNPTRFSKAVDAYYTVPNPRRGVQEYVTYLCMIAEKEKVDLFMPISRQEDIIFDLRTKVPLERQGCRVYLLHPWKRLSVGMATCNNNESTTDATNNNDDEANLKAHVKRRRVGVTESPSVRTQDMVKNCLEYLPKLAENLSLLEMWHHEKYTSTCLIVDGNVIAVSTMPCSPNTIPYHWDGVNEQVLSWAKVILKQLGASKPSGGLTFDLIMSHEGRVFPISCSPQIGEASLNFFNHPDLVNSLVQPESRPASRPLQSCGGPQNFCLYPDIWETLKNPVPTHVLNFCSHVWQSKEAFFDIEDPLPFFANYHLHLPFLIALQLMQGKSWVATDYVSGKLVG